MPAPKSDIAFHNPPPAPPIVFSEYCDSVRVLAVHIPSVASELLLAKPANADVKEVAALMGLVAIGEEVEVTINERADVQAVRPYLLAQANCYGAIYDALVAKSRLPASMGDDGERAARMIAKVFPEGTMFLRAEARSAWFHAARTYRRIVSLGVKQELEEMVGASYVAAARKSTNELGEVMGWGKTQRETPSRTRLANAVTRCSRAIAKYCRLLAAKVEDDDAESIERFRRAVKPIDDYREAQRSGRTEEDEGDEPESPETPAEPIDPSEPMSPLVDPSEEPDAPEPTT